MVQQANDDLGAPKGLYPMPSLKSSPPAPAAGATYGGRRDNLSMSNGTSSSMPRFNYNEYMRTLNTKLELAAPNSLKGSQFE